MIWNGSNRRLESVIVHKSCITSLIFNTDGTQLLSADQVIHIILALISRENLYIKSNSLEAMKRDIFLFFEYFVIEHDVILGRTNNHLES
jgi:hypothetical protein